MLHYNFQLGQNLVLREVSTNFGAFLAGTHSTQTVFLSGSELLSQRTYLCAVWKWYMVFSFREVRECSPSSMRNISRPVCPGPVLMTSSQLRNALKQKAARGRAHFIWLSLFPALIPFLSLSEKSCQSFTLPFPYLGWILSLPLCLLRSLYLVLLLIFSHRYSPALTCC